MKVTVVTPDLSYNCAGRAYLLAKLLQPDFEVEVAGVMTKDHVWEPIREDRSVTIKGVSIKGGIQKALKSLFEEVSGDVLYASKPLLTSYVFSLFYRIKKKTPVILDIDDWEKGFIKDYLSHKKLWRRLGFLRYSLQEWYRMESFFNVWFCENLCSEADAVTVSNRFLKRKYGGEIIWHTRDPHLFEPSRYNKKIRKKYGIDESLKVIMFFGTPHPYKGVEDLIHAVSLIEEEDVVLCITGLRGDPYSGFIKEKGQKNLGERLFVIPPQPFEKVPEVLSMCDVVVIPQRRTYSTIGQVPAKVFDAMAMGKPIVATPVGDLPYILKGCAWIVPPNNPYILSEAIKSVLREPEYAKEMGERARERFFRVYGWDVMRERLLNIISRLT